MMSLDQGAIFLVPIGESLFYSTNKRIVLDPDTILL